MVNALSVESPEVTVTIEPPKGNDLLAYQILATDPTPKVETRLVSKAIYEQVLKLYPKSRYAKYAQIRLAEIFEAMGNFDIAAHEFRKAVEKYPYFGYTDYAKEQEGQVYRQARRYPEALERFTNLLNDPQLPDSRKYHIRATMGYIRRKQREALASEQKQVDK
jgi:tetratricopeptide (TPR) repeat protein